MVIFTNAAFVKRTAYKTQLVFVQITLRICKASWASAGTNQVLEEWKAIKHANNTKSLTKKLKMTYRTAFFYFGSCQSCYVCLFVFTVVTSDFSFYIFWTSGKRSGIYIQFVLELLPKTSLIIKLRERATRDFIGTEHTTKFDLIFSYCSARTIFKVPPETSFLIGNVPLASCE